ncbi:TIGR03621 family F420-dependent LLM class oxidoreductase [Micromonospora sp. WMMD1102]|uniref:TIGR03621 family F420-dependent LLM class oxidoreductase n=1 Tax=Micromonospora sp. WMMD1102 TaxID=3016105 RepID=UPI00241589EA|nr:TIGR03621 family F420-dependent LLM class oxidoreductase [Micromonospora sp. WMMD1102]MDG4789554.1 TIGR03621 family F420-dependent LLM class oxidoreductase [Micromonospora sp. WMMD1102]
MPPAQPAAPAATPAQHAAPADGAVRVRPFRFTAAMPALNHPVARWRDQIRRIEDLGFDSVSVSDHLTGGWSMDPLVAMTVAAEATTRLRLLGLVFCNDFRHPVLLHKALANLDVFSAGRLEIGLGAGWLRDDHDAAGLPFDPPTVRVARLVESVEILLRLFAGGPVDFAGRHYRVSGLAGLPEPVQRPHPPLLVGGGSRRILELAGRRADIVGINPRLAPDVDPRAALAELSPARFARKVAWARDAAAAAGRDPAGLEFQARMFDVRVLHRGVEHRASSSHAQRVDPAALVGSPSVLHGSVAECVDKLLALRDEYGVSYLHLGGNLDAAAPIVARLSGR